MSRGLKRRHRIEGEYGQPFAEIVRGYARAGESMSATGVILGYSDQAFRELVRREGWVEWFTPGTQSNGRRSHPGAPRGHLQAIGRKGGLASAIHAHKRNERHLVEFDGTTDTLTGHAMRQGIALKTVYARRLRGQSVELALRPVDTNTRPTPATLQGHRFNQFQRQVGGNAMHNSDDFDKDAYRDELARKMAAFEASNGPIETTPIKFHDAEEVAKMLHPSDTWRKQMKSTFSEKRPVEHIKIPPKPRKLKRPEVLEKRITNLASSLGLKPSVLKAHLVQAKLQVRMTGDWEADR